MAEYLIKDTTLQSIADAIKEKTGSSDPIPVTEMAAKIQSISVGGSIPLTGDFLKYCLYQIDSDAMTLTIRKIVWADLYSLTGAYDINIPSTCGDYTVVIDSTGV